MDASSRAGLEDGVAVWTGITRSLVVFPVHVSFQISRGGTPVSAKVTLEPIFFVVDVLVMH